MVIETQRLILREFKADDLDDLHAILSDPELMKHYPAPFTREKSQRWIEWNLENYAAYGFGLWAVILKQTDTFIGDCGITMQLIGGKREPEIGYHISRAHTGNGYATEAARACRNYAFDTLNLGTVYSYMRAENIASQNVARRNGMRLISELSGDDGIVTAVYAISAEEYREL